MLLSMCNI